MADRQTYPLNIWKLSDSGELSLVLTIDPMYFYSSTGTFNVVLTKENMETIYDAFSDLNEDDDNYADLEDVLEQEFGNFL